MGECQCGGCKCAGYVECPKVNKGDEINRLREELAKAKEAQCPYTSTCTRWMLAHTLAGAMDRGDDPSPGINSILECRIPKAKES